MKINVIQRPPKITTPKPENRSSYQYDQQQITIPSVQISAISPLDSYFINTNISSRQLLHQQQKIGLLNSSTPISAVYRYLHQYQYQQQIVTSSTPISAGDSCTALIRISAVGSQFIKITIRSRQLYFIRTNISRKYLPTP